MKKTSKTPCQSRIWFLLLIIIFSQFGIRINSAEPQFHRPVRGVSHNLSDPQNYIVVGEAPAFNPEKRLKKSALLVPPEVSGQLTESGVFDSYLPAGKYFAIHFESETGSLNLIDPELSTNFSSSVLEAIAKAPRWLQNDLQILFSWLTPLYQEKWANAILEAKDPYIDEIAFSIAHLSPQYLMSNYASVQLLNDNANLIYENDKYLKYVQVIDYGTSTNDPNYFSTTRYRKVNFLDTIDVEIPREIYYWYLVHPKITSEIPAYIDPDIIEENYSHNNNIVSPEKGYFWRDFLFNNYDPGYAKLKDLLIGCKSVWNEFSGGINLGDDAMKALSRWAARSINFTSNEERPHQPVRIYRKHIGRCGEFGDMRVAIARAALIPAANVASYSTDHVWNEFYIQRWVHWEETLNTPMVYTDSWGKKFGSVFQWRSDGLLIPVTQRYTHAYSTLHIYAQDSTGVPIDGAIISLFTQGLDEGLWFDTFGITDNMGQVTFILGTNRKYYANMQSDLGSVPAGNNLLTVVVNTQGGQEYSVSIIAPRKKKEFKCQEMAIPPFNDPQYYLKIDFNLPTQIVRGNPLFDDLRSNSYQFIKSDRGKIDFFITDEENYQNFIGKKDFQGFHSITQSDSGRVDFNFDGKSDWYAVFDNSASLRTLQHLVASINLYSESDPKIPKVALLRNYPNPVKDAQTTITYQLPKKSRVELVIYNVLGQKIRTLYNDVQFAGDFPVVWDTKNDYNEPVSSGIYFCRIKTEQGSDCKKIVVIHTKSK